MKSLDLRYIACVYPITGKLDEYLETNAETIRDLIKELDDIYGGFVETFINKETGKLNFNTMIYYGEREKPTKGVLDLDQKISDGAKVLFW